jgi:hypothetical protein
MRMANVPILVERRASRASAVDEVEMLEGRFEMVRLAHARIVPSGGQKTRTARGKNVQSSRVLISKNQEKADL